MIGVVDSGSTKADWLFYDGQSILEPVFTIGFNPYFHTSGFVTDTLKQSGELNKYSGTLKELYFYGAGCSSNERKEIIRKGLQNFFPDTKIIVDHDLLACAYATCGDEKGICCILGTGSNSCYFDGEIVHEKNYGLGYILGDEGSGSYYGKKLLTHFLYGLMPADIAADFNSEYNLDRNTIIDHVYKKPDANVWLASFAKFLSNRASHPYISGLVRKGMREFLELYVCNYPDYKNEKVHFVGSLAYFFEKELKAEADLLEIKIGNIVRQPVTELMNYFIRKMKI